MYTTAITANTHQFIEVLNALAYAIAAVAEHNDALAQEALEEGEAIATEDVCCYAEDFNTAASALNKFVQDADVAALESALLQQDSFVRGYYAYTLEVIDDVKAQVWGKV